jgi:hypothetical protein
MGRGCPTEENKPHRFTEEWKLKIKASRDKQNLDEDIGAPASPCALPWRPLEIDGCACFGRRNGPCLEIKVRGGRQLT